MDIFVNGELLDITLEEEKSVLDIAVGIEHFLRTSGQGESISEVKIDDNDVIEGIRESLQEFSLENISKIEFTTSHSQIAFALDILHELITYLSRIPAGAEDIAVLLQSDKIPPAMNHIKDLSNGLEWTLNVINKIDILLDFSIDEIDLDGITFKDKVIELKNILEELIEAFTNEDFILISDLIEYEIVPICEDIASLAQLTYDKIISENE